MQATPLHSHSSGEPDAPLDTHFRALWCLEQGCSQGAASTHRTAGPWVSTSSISTLGCPDWWQRDAGCQLAQSSLVPDQPRVRQLPTPQARGGPAAPHTWPEPLPGRGLALEAGLGSRDSSGQHVKGSEEMAAASLAARGRRSGSPSSPSHPA